MANTYHQIYLQLVFAVKYRNAIIQKSWQPEIQDIIENSINESIAKTLIVNGVEDHIHCPIRLKPVMAVSDLIKIIKSKSSKYINDNKLTKCLFEWQKGYGVFSYGRSQLDQVYTYVENQEEHHKKQSFLEEYQKLLTLFKVEFDENYLFEELI